MITLHTTPEQVREARELYEFGVLRDSFTKGEGNVAGALGEIVTRDFFASLGHSVQLVQEYEYDLTVDGCKVDVKTKRTSVTPEPHFNASVCAKNTRQACDVYLFARVLDDLSTCFLLGWMTRAEFFTRAFFLCKGEKDAYGWTVREDCFNTPIESLEAFRVELE